MKKGIVISTSEYTEQFLEESLRALLPTKYPIVIVGNGGYDPRLAVTKAVYGDNDVKFAINPWNGFELGGIRVGASLFDEFFYLQDTCVVKDLRLVDMLLAKGEGEGKSIAMCPRFMSYIGKYRSAVVKKIGAPKVNTKEEAILMEAYWNQTYMHVEDKNKMLEFHPSLPIETEQFVMKHDQKRMVCENAAIIKYKGTYHGNNL